MNHKVLMICFVLLLTLPLKAQIRQQVAKKDVGKRLSTVKEIRKRIKKNKDENVRDTLYCLSVKRQNGWVDGLSVVDYETAKRNSHFYVLTRPNAGGHWTKLHVMNGYGKYVEGHGESPYILSIRNGNTDVNANKDWVSKLNTVCQYEFIADPLKGDFVQERAYDKDKNLIYTFSRMKIGERKYIGTYRDSYGLPAEMRLDSAYTYGTSVVITEDHWGNDSIVEYVDSKGVPKNNGDGVGMSIQVCDKYGHPLKVMSCNHEGQLVIDNWGHCGAENTFDVKTHRKKTQMTMDDHWRPMPTPYLRMDNGIRGCVKIEYVYDEYGREAEIKVVTPLGEPAVNNHGAHRFVFEYDDMGNNTVSSSYDLDGHLVANDMSGTAQMVAKYDSRGRLTDRWFYDKDGRLNSTPNYFSRIQKRYGANDELEEDIRWMIVSGLEDTCYYYRRADNYTVERFYDGSYEIDSLDSKGRYTFMAFYNCDGTPRNEDSKGFHIGKVSYIDMPHRAIVETTFYDERSQVIKRTRMDADSLIRETWFVQYDSLGQVTNSCRRKWNQDFFEILGTIDVNSFGIPCRAGGSDAATYYQADYLMNHQGKAVSYVGKDELDEPDYIIVDNSDYFFGYYYRRVAAQGYGQDYDEDNNVITNTIQLFKSHSWAMSVEVTDSVAYQYGLKDNDLIVKYGNYQIDDGDTLYANYFRAHWAVESVLEANKEKTVLLCRLDKETGTCRIIETSLPKGLPSDFGFSLHARMLTHKQEKRVRNAMDDYTKTHKWKVRHHLGDKKVLVSFIEPNRYNCLLTYGKKVGSPAVVLAASLPEVRKQWHMEHPLSDYPGYISVRKKKEGGTYELYQCFTKNGVDVMDCTFSEPRLYAYYSEVALLKDQYQQIKKLVKQAKKMMKRYDNSYKITNNKVN